MQIWRATTAAATILLAVACGTSSDAAAPQPTSTTATGASSTALSEPVDTTPSATWNSLRREMSAAELVVGDVNVGRVGATIECFAGTCQDPIEPTSGATAVLVTSTERIALELPRGEIDRISVTRLGDQLRYRAAGSIDGDLDGFSIDEDGLHHVSIRSTITELDAVAHHFLFVLRVPEDATCAAAGARLTRVGPVVDAEGCPTDGASLNHRELHPGFHCAPWPAVVEIDARPGQRHLRTQHGANTEPTIVDSLPSNHRVLEIWIPAGQLATADDHPDSLFVLRKDGTFERWDAADGEIGCA